MSDGEALVETLKQEGLEIRTAPLGGSALSRALQAASAGASGGNGEAASPVAAWLAPRPASADAWRAHAARVRSAFPGDDWYRALAPAISATGVAAARLQRAVASGVVVTTGQQPGLFGGPAYTFSKALGALALADALESETGMPVAPLFWAATDDADWMEAAVTHVATARGLLTAQLAGPPTDGVAMAEVPLGDLTAARAVLDRALGSAPHQSIVDLVNHAYVPQATVGAAYVHLLRALLEPLGIAVLDAAHPAVRETADPHLRRALRQSAGVQEALVARTRAIEAAGHTPQVDVVDGLSMVFHTQTASVDGQVRRVRERVPLDQASQVAREATVGSLGANVLLRPTIERAILPTVCYLAGPGELAYFAQVAPIAEALEMAVPVAAPRWACTLVETQVLRLQARLCISDEDLMDPHAAEQVVAKGRMDADVADSIERLRVTMDTQVRALQETLRGDTSPLAPQVIEGLARDLTHRLDRFERRVLAGVKRREADLMREVAVVRAALRPAGQPPERVLNLIPTLARYGVRVLSAMKEAAMPHAMALVSGAAGGPSGATSGGTSVGGSATRTDAETAGIP